MTVTVAWTDPPPLGELSAALDLSHAQLRTLIGDVAEQLVTQPSYAADWTIAQVASHIGSGAQCFELFVDAGLTHSAVPGVERFQPIWDIWNAKTPVLQAADGLAADAALLRAVTSLPAAEADGWRLNMFGTIQTLGGLMRMRLAEHALHTWDIAVSLDPAATLDPETAGLLLGYLPGLVERSGNPVGPRLSLSVLTSDPGARLRLELSDTPSQLVSEEAPTADVLALPAESFVRLVYGRLDPDHTPSGIGRDDILATLRVAFPGV